MSVCVCECLLPRREVISLPIFKYDISTDAYLQSEGVSENQFKIKPDVEKLFRKNLITHGRHHVLAQKCTHRFGIRFHITCPNFKEIDQKLLFLWAYLSFVIFQNIDIFQGSTKAGRNTSIWKNYHSYAHEKLLKMTKIFVIFFDFWPKIQIFGPDIFFTNSTS